MEKYTALYVRVSTSKQVEFGTSLDYQHEACMKKALELGVSENRVRVYREEGVSGEDIDRPEMNRLREDIKNGEIENLIILHPDRLSRNMVDRLIVCSEFQRYEVKLVFVDTEYKDTEEGKLFFNIQSSIAQYELELIKKRTRRGTISAVKDGKVMPMRVAPFGYDYADGQLIIIEDEAKFVRKIFQWYVYDKLTMREIGERLASSGAIPKRKNVPVWSASTIQKILKNEIYIGKYYYNRRQTKKVKGEKTASGKPKRVYEYRDKEDWILVEVPSIIDVATFALAEDQRATNTKNSGNVKHEYLLKQKIRCGHCGVRYSALTTSSKTKSKKTGEVTSVHYYKRYRCVNSTNRKFGEGVEKCKAKIINANHLEDYIWNNLIIPVLYQTDEIVQKIKERHEKPNEEITEMYNLLKFKMSKFEEEKKRIVQLFKKGYIDEEEMDKDMEAVNVGMKDLQREMDKYEKQIYDIGKQELNIEVLKKMVEEIKVKIENEDQVPFKTKRQIIDMLIDDIIVKWDGDEMKVTCVGVIDYLINHEKQLELCTHHQEVMDTTNIVFNLLYEAVFFVEKKSRENEYTVLNQKLKIS